jgi:L-iditol 2-dehydrogenase
MSMLSSKDPMSFPLIKASVLHGPLTLRTENRTIRPVNPSELQVAILRTGLCGSDLHYYKHFRNGDIQCLEPLTLGHESAGVVVAVGSDGRDRGWKVGDAVALEVGLPCEVCELCLEGRYNICASLKFRSSAKGFPHAQGTLQERINHPIKWCHKLPSAFPLEMGALLEPLSVAIHASRRANLAPGSTVLIYGAGAVGLLVAAVMKVEAEASKVIIADIDEGRVKFARENGFADLSYVVPRKRGTGIEEELLIARSTAEEIGHLAASTGGGKLIDAVFECTGQPSCLQSAIYVSYHSLYLILNSSSFIPYPHLTIHPRQHAPAEKSF